mmetsp:Transcript_26147/g.72110  ORF Transcript_26147/g.72110 Transcript_26147/m.72110 type:complete len:146 (-) Transcript_26147:19-456(-)
MRNPSETVAAAKRAVPPNSAKINMAIRKGKTAPIAKSCLGKDKVNAAPMIPTMKLRLDGTVLGADMTESPNARPQPKATLRTDSSRGRSKSSELFQKPSLCGKKPNIFDVSAMTGYIGRRQLYLLESLQATISSISIASEILGAD